jgi:hypothetical protein
VREKRPPDRCLTVFGESGRRAGVGGPRVIYYLRTTRGEIWMLTVYAKNDADSIPGHMLKRIKEEIDASS